MYLGSNSFTNQNTAKPFMVGVPFFYYERAVKLGYYTKDKPKRYRSGGSPSKSSSFMVDTIAHKRRGKSLWQKIRKKSSHDPSLL